MPVPPMVIQGCDSACDPMIFAPQKLAQPEKICAAFNSEQALTAHASHCVFSKSGERHRQCCQRDNNEKHRPIDDVEAKEASFGLSILI